MSAQLPAPDVAFNTLMTNVHAEVFFGKLASAGYPVNDEKEASEMLELAGKLRQVAPAVKAASSPYAKASQDLDKVLAARGLDGGIKQATYKQREQARRQQAVKLAAHPDIFNAVLSLKSNEAAQVAQQLGLTNA
jgi:hypothetical protein